MGALERDTATGRHIRPELLLLFGLIFPERSQFVRAYYEDVDDRRRRRAGEFEDELLNAARCSPEELIERIVKDERIGELFERAVQEALLAADERKRRALARAVVSGLLAGDTAAIDEAQFRIRAVTILEPAHLRILFALERPGEMQGRPIEQTAYTSIQLGQQTGVSTELLALLLAKLAAEGLISDVSSTVESRTGAGTPSWAITGFGRRVLGPLRRRDAVGAAHSSPAGGAAAPTRGRDDGEPR